MANGSFVQVTSGTGPKLATGPTYTENANTVQDEKVMLGEQYLASYMVQLGGHSTATANSHIFQLMAGASKIVRVRRIELWLFTVATAVALWQVDLVRLSTAGTGGTNIQTNPSDPSDGASGALLMALPTVKGTETLLMGRANPYLIQTLSVSLSSWGPLVVFDFDKPRTKPLMIAAGTTNGIAVKGVTAVAGASITGTVWFDESSF